MLTLHEAATIRRNQIQQPWHRPKTRRDVSGGSWGATFRAEMSASDNGNKVRFYGVASTYEQPYDMYDAFGPYQEIVARGAGSQSLARPDLDVPLVLGHDPMRAMARTTNGTLQLRESDAGLEVMADLDPEDHDVQYVLPKIRSGLLHEMSFAFRIERGVWNEDFSLYTIQQYDINRGDVSVVGFGANPNTTANVRKSGAELISEDETRELLFLPQTRRFLRDGTPPDPPVSTHIPPTFFPHGSF